MKYDLSQRYRIKVTGETSEIKDLLKELCDVMDKGLSYSQIKEEAENLEKLIEPSNYTFGVHHRIYFNKNSILYVPNVSGKEAEKFHYTVFKKLFDTAIKNLEKEHK